MTQVFANLLSNAAKYTERSGRIVFRMTREGDEAVVIVSDTGIGIPAFDLPHIFELFAQVSAHRSRADGGLGIGLSLVRKLVEMHHGTVSASSPGEGSGSTFTVRIPLIEGIEMQDSTEHIERREAGGPRHRILVVDDNLDAAISFATLLRELGHDVDTAFGGHEGVRKPIRCAQT